MRTYCFIVAAACSFLAGCFVAEPIAAPSVAAQPVASAAKRPAVEMSPHAEALQLVFTKESKRIRDVDLAFAKSAEPMREIGQDHWWHDVRKREWTADRLFHPGIVDTTHLLSVVYRIDGKVVASWSVDTRAGTVKSKDETPFGPAE